MGGKVELLTYPQILHHPEFKSMLQKETGSVPSLLLRTLPICFLYDSFYIQSHVQSGCILAGLDHPQFFSGDGGHGK